MPSIIIIFPWKATASFLKGSYIRGPTYEELVRAAKNLREMCGYGSGYSLPNFSLGSLRVSVQALSSQLAGRLPPTALVKPESTVWPWASLKSCFPPQSGWLCSLLVLSRPSRLCPGFGCLSWFVLLFLHFLEAQQIYRRPVHVISASLECLALALA